MKPGVCGCVCLVLHVAGCDEDIDSGQEGGECSLPQQLHLYFNQEVFGLADFPLQVHGAGEAVQLPGAEVTFSVALGDADDDVVAGVGGGRSDSEDLGRNDDVGLVAELVVRDPDRRVLTVQGVGGTADPLTACVGHFLVVVRTVEGQTPESSLQIVTGLFEGAVVCAGRALVHICAGASTG